MIGRDRNRHKLREGDWVRVEGPGDGFSMARVADVYPFSGPLRGLPLVRFYNGTRHYMGPERLTWVPPCQS